jgi:3',5'-cyclic-nucleotide phosphodiesterase
MEKAVGMETALFGGPPELGNLLKLATGQINFMSIFALPLFEGVADLLPQISFAVQQIQSNRTIWQEIADQERRRERLLTGGKSDIARSPRSVSPAPPERQVDGAGDDLPVSSVQENGVGGNTATNVRITLDQPPNSLVYSPSPVAQKQVAENQVDLSKTTVSGFHTPSQRSSVVDQLQRISSVPDMRFESRECALAARGDAQQNRKSYSSGHASLPCSSHGVGRDTRTQSASTCTNTVATPVSPATNATSFVTVDSGDEREPPVYGLSSNDLDPREDENASRPSSSDLYAVMDRQRFESSNHNFYCPQPPRTSQRIEDFGKNHHVMTAILGNGVHSGGSSPVDHDSLKRENGVRFDPQPTFLPRALTKRKSRLRLAFWRRKEPHLHHQRMSGEI